MTPSREVLAQRDLLYLAQCCAREAGGVSLEAMFSRSRSLAAVHARRLFYATLREREQWSPGAIARLVGRDRAAVVHALRQHDARERRTT